MLTTGWSNTLQEQTFTDTYSAHCKASCIISEQVLESPSTKSCVHVTSLSRQLLGVCVCGGGGGGAVELTSLEPAAEAEC
jgi:hypothetical protein